MSEQLTNTDIEIFNGVKGQKIKKKFSLHACQLQELSKLKV